MCSIQVNTQNAGIGELKCHASHVDGEPAMVEHHQLDKYVYMIRIFTHRKALGFLNLFLERSG